MKVLLVVQFADPNGVLPSWTDLVEADLGAVPSVGWMIELHTSGPSDDDLPFEVEITDVTMECADPRGFVATVACDALWSEVMPSSGRGWLRYESSGPAKDATP